MPTPAFADPTTVAPYLAALTDFAERDALRCAAPGHRGTPAGPAACGRALGEVVLELDLPAEADGVDALDGGGEREAPLEAAERLAAEAWGARHTFFLTNGASQGNQAACLAVAHAGHPVVVQRSSHASTFDGIVLAGLDAHFVAPELDPELGIALGVTPEALDIALAGTPGACAAFVVSPTCHGVVADVAGLAEVAHRHGAALVVDEAWGAHLPFSDLLPDHALAAGADLVVSSTHRQLGSLAGSAMLHLGAGAPSWLDEHAVRAGLRLVSSTSPRSLLLASLDEARRRAQAEGPRRLHEAIRRLAVLRAAIARIPGLDVLDERHAGRPGMAAHDPLRVCVDVTGTGVTGWEIGRTMRVLDDVHLELCEERVLVAVFGLGEPVAPAASRLLAALHRAAATWEAGPPRLPAFPAPAAIAGGWEAAPRVSLREATLTRGVAMPVLQAAGLVAAETLTLHAPGPPLVLAGEELDRCRLQTLRNAVDAGATVSGAADPSLATVRVLPLQWTAGAPEPRRAVVRLRRSGPRQQG